MPASETTGDADTAGACQEQTSADIVTNGNDGEGDLKEPLTSTEEPDQADEKPVELVEFKLIYNKEKFDISFPLDKTVLDLKKHCEVLTRVPATMSKLLFKGIARDEKTLREWGLTKGAKVMLVGSTIGDVMSIAAPLKSELDQAGSSDNQADQKEALSQQKQHKKIIDRGVPPDAMPAWRNERVSLPYEPLSGMVNKSGGKVRLTFKLEADQLWIGTKERTEKISMQSVRTIVSEPIEGHEEYHIMGIQLGPTEASRYWVYWVPAQYIDAIKETILGS